MTMIPSQNQVRWSDILLWGCFWGKGGVDRRHRALFYPPWTLGIYDSFHVKIALNQQVFLEHNKAIVLKARERRKKDLASVIMLHNL